MNRMLRTTCLSVALMTAASFLLACDPPPDPTDPRVPDRLEPESVTPIGAAEQEKPGAPVQVDYEVAGTPVVDQITEIALDFRTGIDGPVYASYQPVDSSALSLVDAASGRTAVTMQPSGEGSAGSARLRIIPHREGRHFINVLVEVETETGPLMRSLSIPVEVAGLAANLQGKVPAAVQQPDVETDSSGEAVISVPARERAEQ